MARDGIRIFDADTHIIEPVEPIEAYLSSADRARLAALGLLVQRAPAKAGMSRESSAFAPLRIESIIWLSGKSGLNFFSASEP